MVRTAARVVRGVRMSVSVRVRSVRKMRDGRRGGRGRSGTRYGSSGGGRKIGRRIDARW